MVAAVSALLVASLPGCGGERDAAGKQLEALRAEIVKLRAETAILGDRLRVLERAPEERRGATGVTSAGGAASAAGGGQGVAASSAEDDRPALEVVRLVPEGPEAGGRGAKGSFAAALDDAAALEVEEDDEEPRPLLRSVKGGGVVAEKPPAAIAGKWKPRAPAKSGVRP